MSREAFFFGLQSPPEHFATPTDYAKEEQQRGTAQYAPDIPAPVHGPFDDNSAVRADIRGGGNLFAAFETANQRHTASLLC
jgi:hypothetical protein